MGMEMEMLVQAGLVILGLAMVVLMHRLPLRAGGGFASFRSSRTNTAKAQARRHFLQGAQLLARARAAPSRSSAAHSLARGAGKEADRALALDPRDAASHILKALSLNVQGRHTAALRSLDTALVPPAVRSLSPQEKGDALCKRADLLLNSSTTSAGSRRRRLDSAVSDLEEAVKLSPKNVKAFCLLGSCYERKEMAGEARAAFAEALRIDPLSEEAKEGVDRLSEK